MKKLSLSERILFAVLMVTGIAVVVGLAVPKSGLRIPGAEAIFMLLAAGNVLAATIRRDGLRDAVVSFAILFIGSGLVAAIGTATGRPFGPYDYTDELAPRILGVPLAVPLLWYVVIGSGHYLVFHWAKFRSRRLTGIAVAAWAVLFDSLFEPVAVSFNYWTWRTPGIPAQNYLAWFVLAFLLTRLAPLGRGPIDRFDVRPASVAGILLVLCTIGRIMRP